MKARAILAAARLCNRLHNDHRARRRRAAIVERWQDEAIHRGLRIQGHERRSLQLLVNHNDASREFAYDEPDGASLNAAKPSGWTVISMKDDWKIVFPPED